MNRYHITKNGTPGVCKAKPGNCPLAGTNEHFDTKVEAEEFIQKKFESSYSVISKTKKLTREQRELEVFNNVVDEIAEAGGDVFYVGGYVRDGILGKENKDIDVEIHNIEESKVEKILARFGSVDLIGKSFGVLKIKGLDIDFAFPRTERKVGDNHVDFDVSVDPYLGPEAASRRRDFTMNAIMKNVKTREVLDPHNGVSDLKNGLIQLVDKDTFVEDPLRALRACQFAARFDMKISDEVIDVSKTMDYTNLSIERVDGEIKKAMFAPNPSKAFEGMLKMGVLDQLAPRLAQMKQIDQNPKFHPEGDVFNHTMMTIDMAAELKSETDNPEAFMYAALCHDVGKVTSTQIQPDGRITAYGHDKAGVALVDETLDKLTRNKSNKKYIKAMTNAHMKAHKVTEMKDSKVRKLMTEVNVKELMLLAVCDSNRGTGIEDAKKRENYYEAMQRFESLSQGEPYKIIPFVKGQDLIDMGAKPGPKIGQILENLFNDQIAGNSEEKIRNRAKKLASNSK